MKWEAKENHVPGMNSVWIARSLVALRAATDNALHLLCAIAMMPIRFLWKSIISSAAESFRWKSINVLTQDVKNWWKLNVIAGRPVRDAGSGNQEVVKGSEAANWKKERKLPRFSIFPHRKFLHLMFDPKSNFSSVRKTLIFCYVLGKREIRKHLWALEATLFPKWHVSYLPGWTVSEEREKRSFPFWDSSVFAFVN